MVDSSFNTDYYEDEDDKKSFLDKIKLAVGGITFALSIIIFFSLTSYIFTGQEDQSLVNSSVSFSTLSEESKNWLGVFGAFLSHYLVFKTFGISSFLFVPFLFVLSIRLLFRKKLYSISRIFILSILITWDVYPLWEDYQWRYLVKKSYITGHQAGHLHAHPDKKDKSQDYYVEAERWYSRKTILSYLIDKGRKPK